jgi:hypothetical protein
MGEQSEPKDFLLRVESINLNTFVYDTEDLSTIRGAGMLLLGIHDFFRGAIRDKTPRPSAPAGSATGPATTTLPESLKIVVDEGALNDDSARAPIDWEIGDKNPGPTAAPNSTGKSLGDSRIRLDLISKGASIVIYRFRATEDQAETLRDQIDRWLRKHLWLGHATYAVEFEQFNGDADFLKAMERLLFKLRRRQMRAPNLSLGPLYDRDKFREWVIPSPSGNSSGSTKNEASPAKLHFCDIDGKRPGLVDLKKLSNDSSTARARAIDKNLVSPATVVRRAYGRQTKIRIYNMIGGKKIESAVEENFTPAWEFEDIAARGKRRVSADKAEPDPYSALADKMAVIYIDGNKFQTQIRTQGNTIQAYHDVDQKMLGKRRQLMRAFVERLRDSERPYWRVKVPPNSQDQVRQDGGQPVDEFFRIETLMWGGDELIWVVPAWCALETVRFFFDHTKDWSLRDGADESEKAELPKLTHSVGLVFCSYKSPIRSVVSLARELAESAKSKLDSIVETFAPKEGEASSLKSYNRPEANLLAYQVLESFDHLGADFEAARRLHRFPGIRDEDAILTSHGLVKLIDHLRDLQKFLPRTRLHQIAQVLLRNPFPIERSETERWANVASLPDKPRGESWKDRWDASLYGRLIERTVQTTNHRQKSKANVRNQLNNPLHWKCLSGLPAKWYHVNELWDYLGSEGTIHDSSPKPTSANEVSS